MKHTPGPWTYRPDEYGDWGEVRGADGFMIAKASICRHSSEDLSLHRANGSDPVEATGRLIAAAPDLLAALELLLQDIGEYAAWQRPCYAVDVARAALAKARGEA